MKHAVLSVFLVVCCGCATIFNGKSQDVPVIVPDGTVITDADGVVHPIVRLPVGSDTGQFVKLRRNKDYIMTFSYQGKEVTAYLDKKVDVAWVITDLLFWPILIVDVLTGAWHSFYGMKVDFPADSTTNSESRLTAFELTDEQARRLGGNIMIGISRFFPSDVFLFIPNGFFAGVGYQVTPELSIELTASQYSADLRPPRSIYLDMITNEWSYQLGGRYRLIDDINVTLSGGLTDLSISNFSSRSSEDVIQVDSSERSKFVPSASVGIRYAPKNWFIELKHILGFSPLIFPNGERGWLQATSINFGFIARF